MRVAYIAHPMSGDVKGNLVLIALIGRQINLEEPDVIPFAQYFFDCHSLVDSVERERERGIRNGIALLKKGFIDELRLYGNRVSAGMMFEVDLALGLGIEVKPMTEATARWLQQRWPHTL